MSVLLKSFPFDSMDVFNEESGQMEGDRVYEAEIFRKYFAKFLSNGVYFGEKYGDSSIKVLLDTGLTIRVKKGAGIIEGADYELEEDVLFTLERPASGNRVDRVIIQFNASLDTRNTILLIKEGDGETPSALQRDSNIYEICIAEITVKSTSNLTEEDIVDTRLNKELCGVVNSLISIDGEEIQKQFIEYIDTVVENLVRKDEENVIFVGEIQDKNGKTSECNFTEEYKEKLDGISAEANKTVVNNTLTGTSIIEALSAAMGRKLDEEKQKKITYGTEIPTGGCDGDIYIQYFD